MESPFLPLQESEDVRVLDLEVSDHTSRVQLHNRLESLLEEAHITVSSVVSDLLGTSARRMLQAVGDGERSDSARARNISPP